MAVQIAEPASVISDERLRDGYTYWCRKAARGKLPRRADIDPIEIPHLLPHVRLVDVVGSRRYRYRLLGAEVRQHHVTNPTGRFVDDVLSPPTGPRIVALYDQCCRECRPVYVEHAYILQNGSGVWHMTKALFLPISEDGVTVSQILVFHVIAAPSPTAQSEPDLWSHSYRELVHAVL
jgi:hypothetical protein